VKNEWGDALPQSTMMAAAQTCHVGLDVHSPFLPRHITGVSSNHPATFPSVTGRLHVVHVGKEARSSGVHIVREWSSLFKLLGQTTADRRLFWSRIMISGTPATIPASPPVCLSCRWNDLLFDWIKKYFGRRTGYHHGTVVVLAVQKEMVRNDQYNINDTHTHLPH
jgi:hypothetical protein